MLKKHDEKEKYGKFLTQVLKQRKAKLRQDYASTRVYIMHSYELLIHECNYTAIIPFPDMLFMAHF